MVGRDEAVKEAYNVLKQNYDTFSQKDVLEDARYTRFPLVATIPGVGKTRLSHELPSAMLQIADSEYKKLLSSCLNIYIALGNSFMMLGEEHNHAIVHEIIGTRILYFYFLQTSIIDIMDFITMVYQRKQYVGLQTALEVVQRDYTLQHGTRPSMIYLGIDDFQCLRCKYIQLSVHAIYLWQAYYCAKYQR